MKALSLVFLLLGALPSLSAELVRLRFDLISVPYEFLPELEGNAWTQCQAWKKDGSARTENFTVLSAKTGEISTLQSVVEMLVQSRRKFQGEIENTLSFSFPPQIPHSFYTHDIGETIEFESSVSEDGELIEARISYENDALNGWSTLRENQDRWGDANLRMPIFSQKRLNQSVMLEKGEHALLTQFSPELEIGKLRRVELLFVSAQRIKFDPKP